MEKTTFNQDNIIKGQRQTPFLPDRIKIVNSNMKLGEWFKKERLQKVAGFKFVPEPMLMRNSKGGHLFFLFFASHNEKGKKIVNDIFNKYRKYL